MLRAWAGVAVALAARVEAGTDSAGVGGTRRGTRSNGNTTAGIVSEGSGDAGEGTPGRRSAWTTGAT